VPPKHPKFTLRDDTKVVPRIPKVRLRICGPISPKDTKFTLWIPAFALA